MNRFETLAEPRWMEGLTATAFSLLLKIAGIVYLYTTTITNGDNFNKIIPALL